MAQSLLNIHKQQMGTVIWDVVAESDGREKRQWEKRLRVPLNKPDVERRGMEVNRRKTEYIYTCV